ERGSASPVRLRRNGPASLVGAATAPSRTRTVRVCCLALHCSALAATLRPPGETAVGSAGAHPTKGYPARRRANGASAPGPLRPGVFSPPLDAGAMPRKTHSTLASEALRFCLPAPLCCCHISL